MERHRRRLANIKPALVQPPGIINVVLNINSSRIYTTQNFAFEIVSIEILQYTLIKF